MPLHCLVNKSINEFLLLESHPLMKAREEHAKRPHMACMKLGARPCIALTKGQHRTLT